MMNYSFSRNLITVAALALMVGVASPALAQVRRGGDHAHGRSGGVVVRRVPPVVVSRQVVAPRIVVAGRGRTPYGYRTVSPVVVVGRSAPRFSGPRISLSVAPVRFYRPYYSFQPRLRVGAGFYIGFPVAYAFGSYYDPPYYAPYAYPYPAYGYEAPAYPYPYPPQAYPPSAHGAPAPGAVVAQPGQADTGGASFDITPNTADVLVDGVLMGAVSQFTPMSAPLGLAPGHHHFEVRAAGYQTITFDADIVAGQVTPFQGTMER